MLDLSPNRTAPDGPNPIPIDVEALRRIVQWFQGMPGAMLPLLHAIQGQLGWVPDQAVPLIADELNVSRAEVQGVLDFYHDFRRAPPGRHLVRICRAESCQARGSGAIETRAHEVLGIGYHQTTPDGALTLLPVYCLGNCACSPAVRVDDEILGRMEPDGFAELVRTLRAEVPAP